MAGRIPQQFIDELLARADIVEVIDARVPLKKRGREYVACCPFHNEKTPSFYVSPQKQFYHCFGCGAHGTALGFLMEFEHMDFPEAVETLARGLGMEVPREEGAQVPRDSHAGLYGLMEQAQRYFKEQLRHSQEAIAYLKGRGISGQTAAEWGLGYAPGGWDGLLAHLGGAAAGEQLLQAGLAIRKDSGGYYDRFRNRLMFPIRDRRGRVIAFGGRVLGQGEPKYLNSPETPIFHKGRELYGLYEARKSASRLERLYVVEGYMDVIALAQAGVRNVVATLGTATTREHLERLFRVVPELVFCFDGDRAGRQAAWRALESTVAVLRDGLEAYFLFLPEGEDPDSLVRAQGAAGFQTQAAKAVSFSEFLIQGLEERHRLSTAEGQARMLEELRRVVQPLAPGMLREQIRDRLHKLGKLAGVDPRRLDAYLDEAPPGSAPGRPTAGAASGGMAHHQQVRVTPVRLAIALLLQQPALARELSDISWLEELTLPGVPLLRELLETLRENPHLNAAGLLERWRGRGQERHLLRLLQWQPPEAGDAVLARMFQDAVGRLRLKRDEQRTDYLLSKARREGLGPEEKAELQSLLTRR